MLNLYINFNNVARNKKKKKKTGEKFSHDLNKMPSRFLKHSLLKFFFFKLLKKKKKTIIYVSDFDLETKSRDKFVFF